MMKCEVGRHRCCPNREQAETDFLRLDKGPEVRVKVS